MLGVSVASSEKHVEEATVQGSCENDDESLDLVAVKVEELSEGDSNEPSGGEEREDNFSDDDCDVTGFLEMPECEVNIVPGEDGTIEGVYIKEEPDDDFPDGHEIVDRLAARKRRSNGARGGTSRRTPVSRKRRRQDASMGEGQDDGGTNSKKYVCDVCREFEGRTPREIAAHRRADHGPRPYQCPQCPYKAKSQSVLNRHCMVHAGVKPYACAICDFRTLNPSNLELHALTHDIASRTLNCDECEYTTTRSRLLDQHKAIHRRAEADGSDPGLLHKCPTCGYITSKPSHLRQHLLTHTDERPFACPYCPYAAKQSSHLRQHLVRHTGQRAYPCEQCPYVAAQAVHLEQHRSARHDAVRRYQCSECPYVAAHCSSLSKHKASHANGWKMRKPRS